MNLVDIECPHCGAVGHVEDAPQSPCLMGRCPVCGGHVLYFCGSVLALDDSVLGSHSFGGIRSHIMEQIDNFLESRVTAFLEAYAEELGIDLTQDEPPARDDAQESVAAAVPQATTDPEPGAKRPSVRNPERGTITSEEVRDFVDIDLRLIDKGWYFQKYFTS